ncbi:MAG: hypothetical protein NVSMB2_22230 [Chloroflexota bacterium]
MLATSCGVISPAPLAAVSTAATPPSPDQRAGTNRLDIHYRLTAAATVSTSIVAPDGRHWVLHDSVARPRPGDYVLQFDGTVAGPGPNERSVLPSGTYQVALDVDNGRQQQHAQVPLSIEDADPTPPTITDLTLLPDHISPNFDARDDVTHISYRLAKEARVSAFLDTTTPQGTKRVWMGQETAVSAGEQGLTWDGLANGQPVPNGGYTLGVRARDKAGNIVERGMPLVVEDSGIPDATLVSARISPLQIIRGGNVCVDAIVRNSGQTVLRTTGPEPGYVYNSLDTYSSIQEHAFSEQAGYWRLGLNWSGSTDTSGATYPYRWGFGHDLQPGDEVSVRGCVKVLNQQDKLVYFAGLVQENVAIRNAGAGMVRVDISS